jgi:hypothetical protein
MALQRNATLHQRDAEIHLPESLEEVIPSVLAKMGIRQRRVAKPQGLTERASFQATWMIPHGDVADVLGIALKEKLEPSVAIVVAEEYIL